MPPPPSVASAKAQLKLSGNQAGYTELTADQAGIITQVNVETGQVVAAGTPVAHIAYEGEREVHIRVGETTAQTLKTGTLTDIKLWSQPDKVFQGKVREVSPATDATRSFLVKISLLNPPPIYVWASQPMSACQHAPCQRTQAGCPLLPCSSRKNKPPCGSWMPTIRCNYCPSTVIAYHENGVTVSGLKPGTKVIAAGVHKLSAGQTINPVPYDGEAGS